MPISAEIMMLEEELTATLQAEHDAAKAANPGGSTALAALAGPFANQVHRVWGRHVSEYMAAPDSRRHIWHAWMSADPARFDSNSASASLAYNQATHARGRDLVEQAFGLCPPGYIRLIGKFGAFARRPAVYRAALEVLSNSSSDSAKLLLHHVRQPSDDLIMALVQLPEAISQRTLSLLGRSKVRSEDLPATNWVIGRLQRTVGREAVNEALSTPSPLASLAELFIRMPFPEPPWSGSSLLQPIDTHAKLQQAGVELNNCLAGHGGLRRAVQHVLSGQHYYYRWFGEEPALLCFERAGTLGWCKHEFRGASNTAITERTLGEIARALKGTDLLCLAPVSDCLFGNDYC